MIPRYVPTGEWNAYEPNDQEAEGFEPTIYEALRIALAISTAERTESPRDELLRGIASNNRLRCLNYLKNAYNQLVLDYEDVRANADKLIRMPSDDQTRAYHIGLEAASIGFYENYLGKLKVEIEKIENEMAGEV